MDSDTITDKKGRVLEVKKISGSEKMRLLRGWGQAANSSPWVTNAMAVCFVRSVDGVPVPLPDNVHKVESLVDRLGDEGIEAVAEWYAGLDESSSAETLKAETKN